MVWHGVFVTRGRAYSSLAPIMQVRMPSSPPPALFCREDISCMAFANHELGAYEVFLNIHTGIVPIPVGVGSLDDVFGKGMIPTLEKGLRDAPVPIKAVVMTNPHNPLGRCYSKENLIEMMQFCQRHDLHLIVDEVFALSEHGCSDLRQPRKFTSALAIDAAAHGCDATKIHVIWSISKDLRATGARLVSFIFS
jgi:hypothetical protein